MSETVYDLIVIGGGAAGLSAGIYAQRYKLKNIIITKVFGGTSTEAHLVENYPGFKSISGTELMQKFDEHYKYLGGKTVFDEVTHIKKEGDIFILKTLSKTYKTKTIILAAGTVRRKLNVPGEEEFTGRGVSYCATCDAFFFKGKKVGVVGGSDAAASAAVLLSEYASEVYIIYRRDKLRAEPYWIEKINERPNIRIIYNTIIKEIGGSQKMEYVIFGNGERFELDGLFIEIGSFSSTEFANELGMKIADNGDIIVGPGQETNVPGLFAAGDITTGSNGLRQIITAAAEGAIAAESAYKFLR